MNQKELNEIRRRLAFDKNCINKIYGCFVSSTKEIISYLDEPLSVMPQTEAERYLRRAGAAVFTRTHGRREVAFLNRAWEDVLALDVCLDLSAQGQPLLDHAVNLRPSRCAGFEGLSPAAERLRESLGGEG